MAEDEPSELIHELALLFAEVTGRPYGEVELLLQQAYQEVDGAVEEDLSQADLDALKTRIVRRLLDQLKKVN